MIKAAIAISTIATSITVSEGTESRVPETWQKFYNGPNPGMIDVATARREMPWIIGESKPVSITQPPA
jgi:hypothetical protein